jgi:MFS family permease
VVLGAAEGPAFPVAQQAAFSWFPKHRRNLPGALVTLGVTFGVVLTAAYFTSYRAIALMLVWVPALTGRMVDAQGAAGYQSAVLITGALLLLGAIAAFTLIDPDPDAPALRT